MTNYCWQTKNQHKWIEVLKEKQAWKSRHRCASEDLKYSTISDFEWSDWMLYQISDLMPNGMSRGVVIQVIRACLPPPWLPPTPPWRNLGGTSWKSNWHRNLCATSWKRHWHRNLRSVLTGTEIWDQFLCFKTCNNKFWDKKWKNVITEICVACAGKGTGTEICDTEIIPFFEAAGKLFLHQMNIFWYNIRWNHCCSWKK